MLKKIFLLLMTGFISVFAVSCQDRKISDNLFNVLFFTSVGATAIEPELGVELGDFVSEPDDPLKANFLFDGWFKDASYQEKWNFEVDTVSQSLVLYAKWIPAEWELEYVLDSEKGEVFSLPDEVDYTYKAGERLVLPTVKKVGYSFNGWILVPGEQYLPTMLIYRNAESLPFNLYNGIPITLYPLFRPVVVFVQFSSLMEGVASPKPITGITYGQIINFLPILPDTETHRFVGWFQLDGRTTGQWGKEYKNGDVFASVVNVTLKARWEEK